MLSGILTWGLLVFLVVTVKIAIVLDGHTPCFFSTYTLRAFSYQMILGQKTVHFIPQKRKKTQKKNTKQRPVNFSLL